jgi:hypothetical protein
MAAERRINEEIPTISHAFFFLIFSNFILAQNKDQDIGWQSLKPGGYCLFPVVDRNTHAERTTSALQDERIIRMTRFDWIKKRVARENSPPFMLLQVQITT